MWSLTLNIGNTQLNDLRMRILFHWSKCQVLIFYPDDEILIKMNRNKKAQSGY